MLVSVYTRKIKTEKGNTFIAYSCKDKDGGFYDVRFTKNSNGKIEKPSVIEVDKKNVFITVNEEGYKTLVINGEYTIVKPIEFAESELPDFE